MNGNNAKNFGVFAASERGENKTFWNRVGTAFFNSRGLSLLLNAMPAGNKLSIFDESLVGLKGPFRVSSPVEYEKDGEKRTRWIRVGTALGNKKGLTIFLNAHPINGKAIVFLEADGEGTAQTEAPC